ncbi:chlorophyll A-B binding protein [Aureococcus anophagefferens]|nr:chlorophyll A-B binding protein [Aureococcus anophagefferens]
MPRLVFAALIAAARAFVAPVAPAAAPTALRSTEVGVGPETGGALFDPAGFTKIASPTTMKWFRASELKHGRVAMLANVGWVVQASGYGTIKFPLEGGLARLSKVPLEANAQLWNLASGAGFLQIIATAGMIELITESAVQPHYMAPGGNGYIDIFGYSKSGEDFTDLQNQELKNGRLAMIGIAGFVCSALVPGSVPGSPW